MSETLQERPALFGSWPTCRGSRATTGERSRMHSPVRPCSIRVCASKPLAAWKPRRARRGARADRAARGAPYLREPPHRGRRQREGALNLHGHASVTITYDRYRHLMPGNEEEVAGLSAIQSSYLGVADHCHRRRMPLAQNAAREKIEEHETCPGLRLAVPRRVREANAAREGARAGARDLR